MRFVREKSSAHPASHRENPGCLIEKKNQRHLNIQYSRISPRPRDHIPDLFRTLFGPTEQYMFNFIYDKTNPQLWYATVRPCSTSHGEKTDYFPTITKDQESSVSRDAWIALIADLAVSKPIFEHYSLMGFLLKHMFMMDGTTNLRELEKLHQHAQVTPYFPHKSSSELYKDPLYVFLDLLATQVSLADSASVEPKGIWGRLFFKNSDNNESILSLMQIIHASFRNPYLLQQAIEQDGAIVNGLFNLEKIKTSLEIVSRRAGMESPVLSPDLRTILKEYADKRTHNSALAFHWSNVANEQYATAISNASFFNHACFDPALICRTPS